MSESSLHPIVAQLRPSAEQLPAILERGRDVLVSAGAGTGKTRTLTARILALLAEGVPLRAIVAVTFTIRAASEMRNRLRQEVQTYLARSDLPPHERALWSPIAAQMDAARIGTIHSLCTEILRVHPAEALLDPNFAILDEAQTLLLRRSAVEETLAQLLASADPEDARLVESLGIATLRETISALQNTQGEEATTIDEQVARLQRALQDVATGVERFLTDPAALEAIANLRLALEETRRNDAAAHDKAATALRPTLEAWDAALAQHAAGDNLEALVAALPIASIQRGRGNKQNWNLHFPKPHYGALLDLWAAHITLPRESDPRADRTLIALLPALLRARDAARTRYAQRKSELRALDFDDLETKSHALLTRDIRVCDHWRSEVAALLVDEFQDTNALQRDLLRAIAGDRGVLFMVGDAKQSIYRFRGADVSVFRAERERVSESNGAALPLEHTFRSHPPLLEQLNSVLASAMDDATRPPADFREPFAPLISGDPTREPRSPAPWIEVQLALGTKGDGALENAASALAARLIELHAAGYAWEEMALLCRRASAFGPYEDAFDNASIPYVTVAGSGFHDRPEIRDLLNALRAIADPGDNLALFGFLRSPVVGYSDADLLALFEGISPEHVRDKTPGIWWRALNMQKTVRAGRVVTLLQQLNAIAGRATVAEVLKRFLDQTYYQAALMRIGNDRAARNVGKLLEDAQGSPQLSILQFLGSIDDLRAARGRASEAAAESIGSVQIMTVHKAKGLEFPVVAIGDAGGKGSGRRSDLLITPGLGLLLAMKQEDGARGILFQRAAQLEQEMESAESDRLLYVAATRAREVLIFNGVAGVSPSGEVRLDGWLKAIGGPLGIDEAFARVPLFAALDTRGKSTTADMQTPPAPILLPLAQGATCLVTSSAISPPERQPLGDNIAVTPFDPRMVAPVNGASLPARDAEALAQRRDELARRVAPSRATQTPHHVVGTLFHAALEQEIDPKSTGFDGWIASRAAALGYRDEATLRALRQRLVLLLTRYYASDLHAEVQRAQWAQREVPYTLTTGPADQPGATTESQQETLFAAEPDAATLPTTGGATPDSSSDGLAKVGPAKQGVIDLLFRDAEGNWQVVDFKTDRFARRLPSREDRVKLARYADQLRAYGAAVTQLVGATPRLRLCLLDDHGAINLIEIN